MAYLWATRGVIAAGSFVCKIWVDMNSRSRAASLWREFRIDVGSSNAGTSSKPELIFQHLPPIPISTHIQTNNNVCNSKWADLIANRFYIFEIFKSQVKPRASIDVHTAIPPTSSQSSPTILTFEIPQLKCPLPWILRTSVNCFRWQLESQVASLTQPPIASICCTAGEEGTLFLTFIFDISNTQASTYILHVFNKDHNQKTK